MHKAQAGGGLTGLAVPGLLFGPNWLLIFVKICKIYAVLA